MPKFVSVVGGTGTVHYIGAASNPVVKTANGDFYCVFIDVALDVVFAKLTAGGLSWSTPSVVFAGSTTQLSIWYDRWSNISAGLIHCAYTESVTDDVKYRSIDTENSDALSSETTIFAGASTATGGSLSITRARGGNLGCVFNIDAGPEDGFARSTDVGATWGLRADPTEAATQDQFILLPGWAADNQDMMLFFWDASADEISRKLYDDSADSWAETSIATSMVDLPASTSYPHFAAAVDITNSRNLLVAWSAVDTAGADLRCWHITEGAITEVGNVVTDSTDDQGFCAIGIDTDNQDWYVYYAGETDGSETFATSMGVYYKKSTDDGAVWGPETALFSHAASFQSLSCTPRFDTSGGVLQPITSGGVMLLMMHLDVPAGGSAGGMLAHPGMNGRLSA